MRSQLRYFPLVILLTVVLLTGCKTLEDTKIAVHFHNMVAHYNILFNASEIYKTVVKQTEDAHVDDYNNVIDVYQFGDDVILKNNSSSVDNILKKCSKIVEKHEKSKWIDDTYYLIARSYFFKADFYAAKEAFQYLISTYPKTDIAYESMIWIALCDLKLQKYDEAEAMTSMARSETNLPTTAYKHLFLSTAFVKIRKGDYPSAIENLKKAIPREKKKDYKTRYMFILAQLYQRTGQLSIAAEYFNNVIKRNPDYDMAFNAKIEISRCYPINSDGDARYLRKQLLEMLKDDKNIQYRDQIYFELALIELKLKNTQKAEEYLRKSIENSKGNQNQKAIAYMLLAEHYYKQQTYALSKKYYDSTEVSMNKDYPDYYRIKANNALMLELLEHLVTIDTEDSLLKLSYMPQAKRDSIIEVAYQQELKQKRQQDEKIRSQQLQENQEMDYNRQVLNRDRSFMQMPNDDNNWYFSSPQTLQMGQSEFYVKWGKRVLEDDWRRKKKEGGMADMGNRDTLIVKKKQELVISETDKKVLNEYLSKYSKEKQKYYQNIPITQGMKDISNDKIIEALKAAGDIYAERLKDTLKAIAAYEELLKRYPDNNYLVDVHYKLYNLYMALNKPDQAKPHKDFVIKNYPNSEYALLLSDPEAFTRIQNQKISEAENIYSRAYRMFMNDSCDQLLPYIAQSKEKLITQYQAKLEFMAVVCQGKKAPTEEFIKMLRQFITTYNNYDISRQAQNMLDYLSKPQEQTEETKPVQKADTVIKKSRFVYDNEVVHFYFCLYPSKYPKAADLKIAFSDYNKQYFELASLDISTMLLNKENQLLLVKQFQNKEKAMEYLEGLLNDNNYMSRININPTDFYIISEKNFYILLEDLSIKAYDIFYQKNYVE